MTLFLDIAVPLFGWLIGLGAVFLIPRRRLGLGVALAVNVLLALALVTNRLALANSFFGGSAWDILQRLWLFLPLTLSLPLCPTRRVGESRHAAEQASGSDHGQDHGQD